MSAGQSGDDPGLLASLDRWWFRPAPALRLAVLRVLISAFGVVLTLVMTPIFWATIHSPAERFEPVGVVAALAEPVSPSLALAAWVLTVIAGVASLLGWRFRVSGPLFALGLLLTTSYRNSWGMIFHTENLLVMHAAILAILPAADAWSLDARRERPQVDTEDPAPGPSPRYGWGLMLMSTVTVLAYLIAGVAKLENAGEAWLAGEVLLSHVAWDNLRKVELGDIHSPLGALLSAYPAVFAPLAWASMVLELGAPLALFGRRIARVWALGMWAFHLGVLAIMAILFPYPLSGVGYASLFAVDEPARKLAARVRERRGEGGLARLLPRADDR